jgi:hypothetical protein
MQGECIAPQTTLGLLYYQGVAMTKEDMIIDLLWTARQKAFEIYVDISGELMQLGMPKEKAESKVKTAILEALEENS